MAVRTGAAAAAIDFDRPYALVSGIRVVQRDSCTVQIGTEEPRRMMVLGAPQGAAALLSGLDGISSVGDAVAGIGGDPLVWRELLAGLISAGLVTPASRHGTPPPHLLGERMTLAHRHGATAADRLLLARQDAVVVIDGAGATAGALAALLASAGVGHVHQHHGGAAHGPEQALSPSAAQTPAWQAAWTVRVHQPAAQLPPSMVVLADETPPDIGRAAELVAARIPHLAVRVTQARLVVGPLVLPGRSACLGCQERARTAADAGWPTVSRSLAAEPLVPAAVAAHAAAELAAGQVLDFLDGLEQPAALGATLERAAGELGVRRRSWQPHPECGCRLLGGG